MPESIDWNPIRALAQRVLMQGEPLVLDGETRALLSQSAREVDIRHEEAERALNDPSTATALLQDIRQRIREGSHRLMQALERAYTLRDAGDLAGAREEIQRVLAVEVVPLYRAQALDLLEDMDAGLF